MKYIRQEGIRDCGICCLYNIIRYYKGNIDIEKLRTLTKTNENGTSIYNLVKVSNSLGFNSKVYKTDYNSLLSLEFPLIAYIKINEYYHFVIIDDIDDENIFIFDPIRGYLKYTQETFLKEWQNIIITFEKKNEIVKEKSYYHTFLSNIIKDNKNLIIIISLVSFISCISSLSLSIFLKKLFDRDINNISIFIFLIILKCFIDYIRNVLTIKLNNKLDYDLSSSVYNKIYSLPSLYHHNRPIGDITTRINDLYNIRNIITTFTLSSIIDIFLILIILIIVCFKFIRLLPLILLLSTLISVIFIIFRRDERNMIEKVKNSNSTNNSIFIDNLNGIDTIKNMNIEDKIINKQNNSLINYIKENNELNKLIISEETFINLIELLGIVIIMFNSYKLLDKGLLTIGDLTFIYSIFTLLLTSIKNLINLNRNINESKLSYYRINNLLNNSTYKNGGKLVKSINNIVFKDVELLNKTKLNISINRGENLFITGKSGIGKSNVFKSLIKNNILSKGNIFIDEINIDDIKESSIKSNITYVSQNEHIFNDTIKNNILMYKNINNNDLNKAIKVTLLDKVLKDKNINIDYLLDEDGHNLSGGERQRILIARALLNKTDFIIFDETMNEIDVLNEKKILNNINTEYKKTIILVSHRLDNSNLFDKKIVID